MAGQTMNEYRVEPSMYETTSQAYGTNWQEGFQESFTQHSPYKTITNRRQVAGSQMPKDQEGLAFVHNPAHPCGIQSFSNIPVNTRGKFTNVRRDLYSDRDGLWANSAFNRQDATIDRGIGTYSNLQGGWGRIGPSTYDAVHGEGPYVSDWQTVSYEPATLRSLRDHRNVNPRDNIVPIETFPQNMNTNVQTMLPP